jgi:DNA-binding protein H-NS
MARIAASSRLGARNGTRASRSSASRRDRGTSRDARAEHRTRAKAKPKNQSKKHKRLKWSGRGMLPIWMREEMKGTKLSKEDFAIK